jgi:UDP-2,3-diacylglucosamine hydrolase
MATMSTLFISDLHLDPARPATARAFLSFLTDTATGADTLYILGDFFETWIGDDAGTVFSDSIASALHVLSASGTAVYLQHGNRDFLLGQRFCDAAGCTLLPDPSVINCYDRALLIMHGDSLCTDDADYIELRQQLRGPQWQAQFLAQSVEQRQVIAQQLRAASSAANSSKSQHIMDVNADAVGDCFEQHGVDLLIHGHTHRPDIHNYPHHDGVRKRVVLGDWDAYAWAVHYHSDHSYQLEHWPIDQMIID